MERHNNYQKYERYTDIIAGSYLVAGLAIMFLPFLSTESGVNFIGYKSPFSYVFMGFAVFGLLLFGWKLATNDPLKTDPGLNTFSCLYPAVLAAVSLFVFLAGGKWFAQVFVDSGKQSMLSRSLFGKVDRLAFWWGPFIYCASLAVATYFSLLVNEVVKELRKGII